jgi:hypothetical protein
LVSEKEKIMIDLRKYHRQILSQFGQDGVIEKILETIPHYSRYFVEFGSYGNDTGQGNTAYHRRNGYDGLLMNITDKPYGKDIPDKKYPVMIEKVTAENVNELFVKYGVPPTIALLSIDVDGNDYWIWKALSVCDPIVVCIESNYCLPIDMSIVFPYDPDFEWKGNTFFGASALVLQKLGACKGYALVAVCGCDLIFIQNEYAGLFENINNLAVLCAGQLSEPSKQAIEWTGWVHV